MIKITKADIDAEIESMIMERLHDIKCITPGDGGLTVMQRELVFKKMKNLIFSQDIATFLPMREEFK